MDGQFYPFQPIQFLDELISVRSPQGGGLTVAFISSYSINSTAAAYNFTTVNLGTVAADRIIALVVHPSGGNQNVNINSITINGVSATIVAHARLAGSGVQSAVAWAAVPTGTTGVTVTVTMAATKSRCAIGVWAIYGASSVTDSEAAIPTSTTSVTLTSLTVPTGGVAIVGSSTNNVTNTSGVTVSGATERFDFVTGNSARLQGADTGSAGTNDITFTVANVVDEFAAVGMVFGP